MMETIKDEIQKAIQRLRMRPSDIHLLHDDEGHKIFTIALTHFVGSGNRRWWWEDFRFPSTSVKFANSKGFKCIEQIVPNKRGKIWFIVEDTQLPFYPVYEVTPEAAQAVIGECYAFEYYLLAKDLSWLVCETHHNVLIAIGKEVEERLCQINAE